MSLSASSRTFQIVAIVLVLGLGLGVYEGAIPTGQHSSTSGYSSTSTATTTVSLSTTTLAGERLGFWVSDDDIWNGGSQIFGIQSPMTPQQFFTNYFMTPPYPASMLWVTGLSPSGPFAITPVQDAQWLNSVAALADSHPNIKMMMLIFANISGNSIILSTVSETPGLRITRNATLTNFSVTGLNPSQSYNIVLNDYTNSRFASMTTFTTTSSGSGSGTFAIPNTPNNNQVWYIVVQGTGLSDEVALQGDQTGDLTAYMQTIKGHSSIFGAQFEPEYFGNTAAIKAKFTNIVNNAGYNNLVGDSYSGTTNPILYFSAFPWPGGAIPSVFGGNAAGINYGEVGTPDCSTTEPCPIWTQSTVLAIVNNTPKVGANIFDMELDVNNPAGSNYLWSSPTVRQWIATDPYYQANYLQAN